ncbi:hypothetical protein [Actinophytocola xanthii]|uniref:Glycoside hydrolase family 5 domain-containing protein n=1 Tax=Actinophytocola xanthii TaxID=1912961 RepID=A0A1Q8C910_9PSEU|nr:hypothetical protein [Actinophytocola xanthii]OLF10836.1 hypothetical protein BU204_31000 [Actinophytocola xanthii]
MSGNTFTRRAALVGGAATLGVPLLAGARPAQAGTWGRIANGSHVNRRVYTGLFFGGPHNPNSVPLFTRHPLDPDRLDWTSTADIRFALQRLVGVGLNTVTLSYFGHEGDTDAFAPTWLFSRTRWPHENVPGTYTEAEQIARVRELFAVAREVGLLVAPLLEVTPNNRFFEYFPTNLDVLLDRAGWLLKHFGDEPNFLRVFDRTGKARHVLGQIEAIHLGQVDPVDFAAGFDTAARLLHQRSGHLPGWWLDPTPLPPFGSHAGPDPAALRTTSSVLGINPFNITSQSPGAAEPEEQITPDERMAYARQITRTWAASGIPYLAPLLPGYDARIVFPHLGSYGFTTDWLRQQRDLAVNSGNAGVSFTTLNGFTEGYVVYPTEENGDTITRWAAEAVDAHRAHWI